MLKIFKTVFILAISSIAATATLCWHSAMRRRKPKNLYRQHLSDLQAAVAACLTVDDVARLVVDYARPSIGFYRTPPRPPGLDEESRVGQSVQRYRYLPDTGETIADYFCVQPVTRYEEFWSAPGHDPLAHIFMCTRCGDLDVEPSVCCVRSCPCHIGRPMRRPFCVECKSLACEPRVSLSHMWDNMWLYTVLTPVQPAT